MTEGATVTSPGSREALFEALGEAELFVIALHRPLRMAINLTQKFTPSDPAPESLTNALQDVKELGDAFEHIDERALKPRRKKPDAAALTVFEFQGFLFQERALRYHQSALAIDQESTDLIIETRDYIVKAWTELCGRPSG